MRGHHVPVERKALEGHRAVPGEPRFRLKENVTSTEPLGSAGVNATMLVRGSPSISMGAAVVLSMSVPVSTYSRPGSRFS